MEIKEVAEFIDQGLSLKFNEEQHDVVSVPSNMEKIVAITYESTQGSILEEIAEMSVS